MTPTIEKPPVLFDARGEVTRQALADSEPAEPVARADSPPQVEAAENIRPAVGGQERRILLELHAARDGMTRREICDRTNLLESSLCARLREMECPGLYSQRAAALARDPWVRKGQRRRPPGSRTHCWVYHLTDAGRQAAREAAREPAGSLQEKPSRPHPCRDGERPGQAGADRE